METLAIILVVLGALLVLAGAVLVIRPSPQAAAKPEGIKDAAELIKEVRELLLVFEQKFRTGIFLMLTGLALIGAGAWFQSRDAKDTVEEKTEPAPAALVRGR